MTVADYIKIIDAVSNQLVWVMVIYCGTWIAITIINKMD